MEFRFRRRSPWPQLRPSPAPAPRCRRPPELLAQAAARVPRGSLERHAQRLCCRAARSTRARRCSSIAAPQTYRSGRSEEHTSELQSRGHLVCRLLLEKKKRIGGVGNAKCVGTLSAAAGAASPCSNLGWFPLKT